MSDGPSDAMAEARLADAVDEAAHNLANAIRDACIGHRGYRYGDNQITEMVNGHLLRTGFKLTVKT